MESQAAATHPIRLVNNDDLRRSRLTVFFRLLLAIPHMIWLSLWGIAVYIAGVVGWLIGMFTGELPEALHDFIASYARYFTHVYAYWHLLADPFPSFSGSAAYPVDLEVGPPEPQSRLTIFFRFLLAIPAFILAYVFRALMSALALIGWFYALATGRMSEGIENLGNFALRYESQTFAYTFLLTGKYPSLSGGPTA
jgi:Domain of unknown function (DUF4389)